MNRNKIIVGIALVAFLAWAATSMLTKTDATSVPGEWTTLEDAFQRAQTENKKVMVDVYTDWCSWCKQMDEDVFANPDVQEELKRNFIIVKLNAESEAPVVFKGSTIASSTFASSSGVTGYPTVLFFDKNSERVATLPGYFTATKFASILSFVHTEAYRTSTLEEFLSRTK